MCAARPSNNHGRGRSETCPYRRGFKPHLPCIWHRREGVTGYRPGAAKFIRGDSMIKPRGDSITKTRGGLIINSRGFSSYPLIGGIPQPGYNTRVAGVAEWQTRRTQNALPSRACGFDSHLRHNRLGSVTIPTGLFFIPPLS